MFERIARSWELTKQSGRVLVSDKKLVIFPVLSTIACMFVVASFAIPIIIALQGHRPNEEKDLSQPLYWVASFAFYFINYLIIAFFNSALVACAMKRFDGRETSVSDGLGFAVSRLPQILAWSLLNATVGMVLRAISERAGIIGRIVIGLIGMVWGIATYFAVPVLVVEGLGPIAVVRRSVALVKKMWGESLSAHITVSALSGLAFLVCLIPSVLGGFTSAALQSPVPIAVGVSLTILMFVTAALVFSTLNTIVLAATYRYASTGQITQQFDTQLLQQPFRHK